MSRLQAVTRRAAWAVFLLFAAVLLVVAPAEASLPRSAGVTQVDAVALASLERPALGLASPALEPSGFSLGEDLGVLDTAGAPGSLGLCGLETRRCALAYARNDPLKYVDPDGKENELAWDAMQRDQVREHYGDAAVTRMDQQRAVIGVTALGLLAGGVAAAEWGPGALMLGRELFTRFGDKTERAAAELQAGAFESAAAGGKHGGFLANYASRSLQEIQKGIGSIEKLIATHQDKIANPEKYIKNFKSLDPRQQAALLNSKWPSDIARQREQLQILRRLAEEKLKELK